MKNKSMVLKKLCATVTAVCFTLTVVGNNLYASINVKPIEAQKQYFDLKTNANLDTLVSNKYGKVLSCKNNISDTVVINIQDLHCDYFVQKNISSLIEELSKKYKIEDVYVEGGIGKIDTSLLSNIDQEFKQNILDSLLKTGKLTGTEYYSAMNDKPTLLKGVEEKDIYLDNILRLTDIIDSKDEVYTHLSKVDQEIEFLKAKYLKSENKRFDSFLKQKENKEITQEQFVSKLFSYAQKSSISLKNYKNLQTYLSLLENSVNNKKVQKELLSMLNEIKKALSYEDYNRFISYTSNLTNSQNLRLFVEKFCDENNMDLSKVYPNLNRFFSLQKQYMQCNPVELVKEERNLIDAIRTSLSNNQTELEIAYLSDFEPFYKGYLSAALTSSQWEYVKLGLDKFKEIYAKYSISNDVENVNEYAEELNSFYDTNNKRNEIFVSKMNLDKVALKDSSKDENVSDILSKAKRVVILVAGGYHTDGINEILNQKGITNITITPNITKTTQKSRIEYEYLAQQQATSIRQMIALGLISNATQKEQIVAIADSLFADQKLDGVNINILVEQLNRIFHDTAKVSLIDEAKQIEFEFNDGTKQVIDVEDDIVKIVNEQKNIDLSSSKLVQLDGEELKEVANKVLKTTFNTGQNIFNPQIYQISKDVCLFMVKNKWYLGNGAVWEIANSEYNGQTLDGVEPIIYEYMPDFMQKALKSKQISDEIVSKSNKSKRIIGKITALLLSLVILFNLSACSFIKGETTFEPYKIEEISVSSRQKVFNDGVAEVLSDHYVGNGTYKSFLFNNNVGAFADDRYALINLENLYDQSLAALSYMQIGDVEKASEILNAINAKPFLSVSNLETNIQKTGEVVWVGIAAVQYKLLTGDSSVDSLIERVDTYLEKNHAQDVNGYFYWGGNVGRFVSTEHYFDILSYFNLKSLLYEDKESEEAQNNEILLKEVADYIYYNLYNEDTKTLNRGLNDDFQVLDVYSWGVQSILSLKSINPEIYYNSAISNIDIDYLLDYADNTFKKEVVYNDKEYQNLYKWSYEGASPVSFEWTMELAIAYKMAGDTKKAEEIMKDVKDYSKDLGFDNYIPYSDVDGDYNYFYYGDGWKVWKIPALCTKAQEVQYQYNSFYLPLTRLDRQENYFVGQGDSQYIHFDKYQDTSWKTYASSELVDILHARTIEIDMELLSDVPDACVQLQLLTVDPNQPNLEGTSFGLYNQKYYFDSDGQLKIVLNMEDFLHIPNYDPNNPPAFINTNLEKIKIIVIAGKTSFFESNLNSKNLDVNIKNVTITYADESVKTYSPTGESLFSDEKPDTDIPSSILPATLQKINKLIQQGKVSMKNILKEILNSETTESFFSPLSFIKNHSQSFGAKILIIVTAVVFLSSFGILLANMIPAIVAALSSISIALFANAGTHALMDYRYLKSIGLSEAIDLYGKNRVRIAENGLVIKDAEKIIPVYVINDKPKNINDLDLKPVPIKIKTKMGKNAKCWIGNYKGATIIFSEGAEYENIVNEFAKTKQYESMYGKRDLLKANVDVIEVDMVNSDSGLRYSKNGNPIVGMDILKNAANRIDVEKEISLLKNKKIEAVTINQNIAIYIDDEPEAIASSQDFVNAIKLYVNSNDLGLNAKILFTNKYINKVLDLLEIEYGNKELAQQEFIKIVEKLKQENKEISLVLEQTDIKDMDNYKQYGIFSYMVDKGSYGCEYIDTVSDTKIKANFINNLNQIKADGNMSIIKVSAFKEEISKTSGLYTFLSSSLNLKEILQKRTIEFIRQTANNFDFNQIPNMDIEEIARIIVDSNKKFENLSKYLNGSDSISMYYIGLSNDEQKDAFMEEILKRALVVNYLRNYEQDNTYYGLKDKNLENILARALVEKYKLHRNFDVNSDISLNEATAATVEFDLLQKISQLTPKAFEANDPQSIDDIIKLIPLYAERNVELRTANVKVMEIRNIKGILSAA